MYVRLFSTVVSCPRPADALVYVTDLGSAKRSHYFIHIIGVGEIRLFTSSICLI